MERECPFLPGRAGLLQRAGGIITLCEAHKSRLSFHYAIDPERPEIQDLEKTGLLKTVSSQEIDDLSGWRIDGPGIYIGYPGNGAFVIRPDTPLPDGPKYIHPKGEPNHVYIPPGLDLIKTQDLWITEGELKALAGFLQGLPIVALGGVWSWKTAGEEASLLAKGEKLKDKESLLPELAQVDWSGKKINLLYDSDIVPGHKAYDAFPRLAEQLYRLGTEEVRVLTLPPVVKDGKTGLDDFIIAKGPEQALQALQAIRARAEPYLPWRDGGLAFAERQIKSENLEDKQKAVVAYLGAKGEVFTLDWLKHQAGLQSDVRKALISEAKKRLKELQSRPKASSSQEPPSGLGPEYEQVKTLLQPLLQEQYGLDEQGRLGRFEWETYYENGQEVKELIHKHFCNFAAWPVREILKDSGLGEPEKFLELQGLLPGGVPLRPIPVSLTEFLDKTSSCLGKAWGVNAAIKPKKDQDLRYLLQLMARGIPMTTVHTHLGWKKENGKWVYLHAGGAIGSKAVEVEISDRLRRYSLPEAIEDIKKAVLADLSLLELGPKKIMYSLLALVYLAPLCEPLRQAEIEPSLLMYIWGSTGTNKSTLIALLLSHYGNFGPKGLPASFRDTANSIEKLAFLAKDTVLSIDDLYPAKNSKEKERLEGVLEHLSRNQGDRTGKGRMKADTSLREGLPPRGLTLCSGEVMPLTGSSLARGLIHRLQRGDIDLAKLTQAQAQKDLLSQAMKGYLEWLAPQLDDLPSELEEAFTHLRQEAARKDPAKNRHSRLNESISHLHIGLNAFIKFAVSLGALSQEEGETILQEGWEIFNQIADEQTQLEKAGEPSKKIAEASMELEAQGRIYWADMEDIPGFLPGSVKVGWKDEGRGIYYTNLGSLLKEVTQHLRGQGENIYLSKSDFISYLDQNGLLAEKDKATKQNRDQKTIWIKDNSEEKKTRKTYAIAAKFFEEGENEE